MNWPTRPLLAMFNSLHSPSSWIFLAGMIFSPMASAGKPAALLHPTQGVLCDMYFCADAQGISLAETQKHLGHQAAAKLASATDFNRHQFTYANGVFCDTAEKICRKDRYFGENGQRSGAVMETYTQQLFGP